MDARRRGRLRERLADRRVVDAVVVLACLGLAALAVKTPWSPLPLPVVAAAGVVGSVAQWTRRRWPQVACVVGAVAYPLSGNPGPLLAGVYAGAAYSPRRQAWALGVVGWAGFVGLSSVEEGRFVVGDAVYGVLLVGLVVAVGVYAATRKELIASLREQADRAEAERELRDERARTAERTRIAREMHDVLAHKVSLIALYAGALELHAGRNSRLEQGAAQIRVTAREALQELRAVLGVLRAGPDPRIAAGPSLESIAGLASLVAASRSAGQPVELDDRAGDLPPATARVVHRIVQEGLTNAHKHAPGAATTVSVERAAGSVTVTVRNAGGATPLDLPGTGSGLIGLAERIRLVGGSLRSGPLGDGGQDGWELQAVVPWLDEHVPDGGDADGDAGGDADAGTGDSPAEPATTVDAP
jgi:signal transduction histidine kinase